MSKDCIPLPLPQLRRNWMAERMENPATDAGQNDVVVVMIADGPENGIAPLR